MIEFFSKRTMEYRLPENVEFLCAGDLSKDCHLSADMIKELMLNLVFIAQFISHRVTALREYLIANEKVFYIRNFLNLEASFQYHHSFLLRYCNMLCSKAERVS